MMVQNIEEEINQTKNHLASLKNCLKEIQQNCDHQFKGNNNYEKCVKCNKTEALYY
ncbi:serine protease [Halobacillus shinanisalinarum]|uniref:Serine protease n=1 Tax=Halobacillus shinanisalinarum TaxID=2932258 RepID=A0ABY4GUM3_9BACI|nr:serine protease [Halobacillus shinanisalinarum]UOQ91870.1 serine protease [Halobacillus shinanisalinarum]